MTAIRLLESICPKATAEIRSIPLERAELIIRFDLERNFSLYKNIHKGHKENIFSSLHDISEGGMAVTLAESCFGGSMGLSIDLPNTADPLDLLFNETPGRFVVTVHQDKVEKFEKFFETACFLGKVTNDSHMRVEQQGEVLIKSTIKTLFNSWRTPIC